MLKLWKVGNEYALADGPAGGVYLTGNFVDEPVIVARNLPIDKPKKLTLAEVKNIKKEFLNA